MSFLGSLLKDATKLSLSTSGSGIGGKFKKLTKTKVFRAGLAVAAVYVGYQYVAGLGTNPAGAVAAAGPGTAATPLGVIGRASGPSKAQNLLAGGTGTSGGGQAAGGGGLFGWIKQNPMASYMGFSLLQGLGQPSEEELMEKQTEQQSQLMQQRFDLEKQVRDEDLARRNRNMDAVGNIQLPDIYNPRGNTNPIIGSRML